MKLPEHESIKDFNFLWFLGFILSVLVISPSVTGFIGSLIIEALFTFFLLSAIAMMGVRKHALRTGILLVIPSIALLWFSHSQKNLWILLAGYGFSLIFIGYVIFIISQRIFLAEKVRKQFIYGAVGIYFLTGVFWAILYTCLELLMPGSFDGLDRFQELSGHRLNDLNYLLYYSFVTLTTVGYGDITPLAPLCRSFSVIEAIMGQFYIAVLVSGLISRMVTQKFRI